MTNLSSKASLLCLTAYSEDAVKTGCMCFVPIFFKLIKTNLIIVRPQLAGKLLNVIIRSLCPLYVSAYVFQFLGVSCNIGLLFYATIVGSVGLFECYGQIPGIVVDLTGDRCLSYYLALPVRPWVVLFSMACSYALVGLFLTVAVLLAGKMLLFNIVDFAAIAWGKLVVILLLANVFYGMLTIALTGYVRTALDVPAVWDRFIVPMWLFGGFYFAWETMQKASVVGAYAMLLSPMTYAMEGMRIAIMGQTGHLPWLLCIGGLSVGIVACWVLAYRGMKKRLDFVYQVKTTSQKSCLCGYHDESLDRWYLQL